jgi:hypothetical protein
MLSLGCGKISNVIDPLTVQKYLIHHFYSDEPEAEINKLTDKQKKCLDRWANKFHVTPLSQIKKNEKNTKLLKTLLHIGMEKFKNHIQPIKASAINRSDSSELSSGIEPKFRKSSLLEPLPNEASKIGKESSAEEGFSFQTGEPTVDDILKDPWVYFDWQISQGRLNKKGGSTRRKKSRGRKTRKYL